MGCNCTERKHSIQRAGVAIANGNFGSAAKEMKASAKSFVQDLRSTQARRDMLTRLTKTRQR